MLINVQLEELPASRETIRRLRQKLENAEAIVSLKADSEKLVDIIKQLVQSGLVARRKTYLEFMDHLVSSFHDRLKGRLIPHPSSAGMGGGRGQGLGTSGIHLSTKDQSIISKQEKLIVKLLKLQLTLKCSCRI